MANENSVPGCDRDCLSAHPGAPLPAAIPTTTADPCAGATTEAVDPCAAGAADPCAGANPCAATDPRAAVDPCAGANPCAAADPPLCPSPPCARSSGVAKFNLRFTALIGLPFGVLTRSLTSQKQRRSREVPRVRVRVEWGYLAVLPSAENRDLFASNPEAYAPQYGGYCCLGRQRWVSRFG